MSYFRSKLACAGLYTCLMMVMLITLITTESVKATNVIEDKLSNQPNQRVLALLIHGALREWDSKQAEAQINAVLPNYIKSTPNFPQNFQKFTYLIYNIDRQSLERLFLNLNMLANKRENPGYITSEVLKLLKPGIQFPGDSQSIVESAASLILALSLTDVDINNVLNVVQGNWKEFTEQD